MGHKPSSNLQSDRPESGGADHNEQRENSGLLERQKQEFAASRKAIDDKRASGKKGHPHSDDARSDD